MKMARRITLPHEPAGGAAGNRDRAKMFTHLAPCHRIHTRPHLHRPTATTRTRLLKLNLIAPAVLLCATLSRCSLPSCEATLATDGLDSIDDAQTLQQTIDSLAVELEAMSGEVKSCNAEEARRQAEIAALKAQIRYTHLRQENVWLRAELMGTGAQDTDVDAWLCARGIEPFEGPPCEVASAATAVEDTASVPDPGLCSRIVHIRGPACDDTPGLRLARHSELEQCKEAVCELLPQWGIAQGLDATMHGKGYECILEANMSPDGQGESVCLSLKTNGEELAAAHSGLE